MLQVNRIGVPATLLAWSSRLRAQLWTPSVRLGLILLAAGILAYQFYRQIQPSVYPGMDFHAYYAGALAIRHGASPYADAMAYIHNYKPTDIGDATHIHSTYMGYIYAPLLAVLLIPLTFLPYHSALVLWGISCVLFLLLAIYALLRAAGMRPSLLHVLVLGIAAARLWPVALDLRVGQVNIFLLMCISTALWARQERRIVLAGTLLAAACITKPLLLDFLVFLLWKRELKFMLTTIVASVVLLLAPFAWLGGNALRDLLTVWRFGSGRFDAHLYSFAPKGVLIRLFTVNPFVRPLFVAPMLATVLWLAFAAAVAVLSAAVVVPGHLRRDARSLLEAGVAVSALLLVSPLTQEHYLALLVLPFVGVYVLLRQAEWWSPIYRWATLGCLTVGLLLSPNVQKFEWLIWPRLSVTSSVMADVYVLLVVPYLYLMIALFGLQVYLLARTSGRGLRQATNDLVALLWQWFITCWDALARDSHTRVGLVHWRLLRTLGFTRK